VFQWISSQCGLPEIEREADQLVKLGRVMQQSSTKILLYMTKTLKLQYLLNQVIQNIQHANTAVEVAQFLLDRMSSP
jgi:hypothetical protein